MKKDYSVLLIQLDGNLASDVSTDYSVTLVMLQPKKNSEQVVGWETSDAVSHLHDGAGYHPYIGCKNTAKITLL